MRAAFDVLEVLFMLAAVDLLRDAAANHIYLSIIFVYLLLFVYLLYLYSLLQSTALSPYRQEATILQLNLHSWSSSFPS